MPQMPLLDDDALKELLSKPLVAKLATTSRTGSVRITPIWFGAENGTILMNTFEDSAAVKNLKRNRKCSLLIDTTDFPYTGVHYWGSATVEGPENDADGMGKLFANYQGGQEAATEYAKQLISWGRRVYIRFTPERSTGWDFRQ